MTISSFLSSPRSLVTVAPVLTLTLTMMLLLQSAAAFDLRHSYHQHQHQQPANSRHSSLSYRNDGANTDAAVTIPPPPLLLGEKEEEEVDKKFGETKTLPYFLHCDLHQQQEQEQVVDEKREDLLRERLKRELAIAAIEQYEEDGSRDEATEKDTSSASSSSSAESIMKRLERSNPWPYPAHHPSLNARWSFVFTGVPTIGMRLITLLSRLSVGFPIIDFRDVYLEIFDHNRVRATVSVDLFDKKFPLQLNVYTTLQQPTDAEHRNEDGTYLLETFDKLVLNGIEIPTPDSWKSTRTLQISYLDDDFMIARTAGGEPHLLLRHSICQTNDDVEECDIDDLEATSTSYLKQARARYGPTLTRSLVDREYYYRRDGDIDDDDDNNQNHAKNMASIIRLIQSILEGKTSH